MNGFLDIIAHGLRSIGLPQDCIHFHQRLELPGYFRATKMFRFPRQIQRSTQWQLGSNRQP